MELQNRVIAVLNPLRRTAAIPITPDLLGLRD